MPKKSRRRVDGPRGIVGEVVVRPLASVKLNGWNPHRIPPHLYESLKHGLKTDGWLAAQALLVWGTDERGERRDTVIDGEHRWRAATELGMVEGPMVFLDGLTLAQAKAHTVKMDSRRGSFQEDRLAELLRDVGADVVGDVSLDLGLAREDVDRMLADHPAPDLGDAPRVGDAQPTAAEPRASVTVESMADFEEVELDLADLRAPFPWFGGKRRVAHIVWSALGNVKNYVEPFFGSGAVLLRRPGGRGPIETVNDVDSFVANVWRAIKHAPEEVARLADDIVLEDDLHARHKWLISREEFRRRMRDGDDPEYFDAKVAAWWIWGACLWIGSGWCALGTGPSTKIVRLGNLGQGVHAQSIEPSEQVPHLTTAGMGLHAREQIIRLGNRGHGVDAEYVSRPSEKIPTLDATGKGGGRPSLSEQLPHMGGTGMDHGRGVHASTSASTENIRAWMLALCERMRRVRVANGDFERVLTPAVTFNHGLTGVLLDPPYAEGADDLYGHHDKTVSARARRWALEAGSNPLLRIAFCGYEGEHGPDPFPGWREVRWKASGGYGNNNGNEYRERIWLSPHALPRGAATGFEGLAAG